ncbi:hypothetical protein [Lysinibacillus sp. BPa_S21]|uniref:hypothetical protein n=1 Tax=Lysinibacillus sp. BPa_S21 TaxID=2932478 RepID=UPI002013164F|nr:hypothetical protein [Lysinibacillus sp. BPa_S21]MCL1696353.1 hypothetical protein [Lysinibacillus sp. BPa_S21]
MEEEYIIRFENGTYFKASLLTDCQTIIKQVEVLEAQVFESFQFINDWIRTLNKLSKENIDYVDYKVEGVYKIVFESYEYRVIEKVK